jgi:PadR family transcriptional regulator, regulatory protein PadR
MPTLLTRAGGDAYIVDIMAAPLGEFEVVVLLAVLHLGEIAYPPLIRAEIERRARRAVARGAVYVTLDRLEGKGLLSSRGTDDGGDAGGRPRRYFRVSPKGLRAVRQSLAVVERMRSGLEPLLDES